jgi:uncharacterized membrane protein YiaA
MTRITFFRWLVRVSRFHPFRDLKTIRIWLASWAGAMVLATTLAILGYNLWTPAVVWAMLIPTTLPALLKLRFQRHRINHLMGTDHYQTVKGMFLFQTVLVICIGLLTGR